MNTKRWILTIPETNRKTITTYSDIIAKASATGRAEQATEYAEKMRGYLECMKDCGLISENGLRVLYLYYRSTRVDAKIKKAS